LPFFRTLRPSGLASGLAALLALTSLPALPALAAEDYAGAYLAARHANIEGDYAAVVEFGTRALARDPENRGLMEGLIIAQVGLGRLDDAVPVARRLISLAPDDQIAGLVMLADTLQREAWEAADKLFDDGLNMGPLMNDLIRAWTAIGQGRMSHAVELFDGLASNEGSAEAALFQKAMALALVGDYEGAADILGGGEMTLRLNRNGIIAYAQILSQLERNPDAVDMLDRAFADTTDPELTTLRAELMAGKPIAFDAVASARAGLSQLFYEVGDSLQGETDPGLVLIYARMAEHLKPDNTGAILLSAQVLEDLERYELAAEAYDRITPENRAYPQAQLGKATALRRIGETDAGIAVLEGLAKDYPDISAVQIALGDALRFEQRYGEATPFYDAAIAMFTGDNPGQWAVYFARAITLEREGQWDKAEADFRKALELSPDQPSVLNYLGYSYVEQKKNLDEALGMIERAVAARPFDGYIRDSLGWVFYRLGRYDEAVEEMERAVELMPTDPVLNDHLGDVYWAVDRKREARFQWSRALSFITDETDPDELKPERVRRKLEVGLDVVLEEEGGDPIRR
jgi:tetratricopeptide (TPR) repeat protein